MPLSAIGRSGFALSNDVEQRAEFRVTGRVVRASITGARQVSGGRRYLRRLNLRRCAGRQEQHRG
jgi:hypothetical protein